MAVEVRYPFAVVVQNNRVSFISEEYNGLVKQLDTGRLLRGEILLDNEKTFLFFWRNREELLLEKRKNEDYKSDLNRYKVPIFESFNFSENLIYGRADGYWTETPYLDDPYVKILSRGMVNFWKGEKELVLKMDIYTPMNDSLSLRPLVLLVHGGAYYIGNKQSETEKILAEQLVERGYVVASIDYRMGFRLRGYDIERSGYKALQDVHASLRYLSAHSEKFGIDPMHVYVAGTSAGAIASLNVAYLDNNERPESTFKGRFVEDLGDIETSGNDYTETFQVKGVGNMWGAVIDTAIIDKEKNIPVISFHGTDDEIVPFGHDHPFEFAVILNRLVTGKMYGSKPIHEHLDRLNIDNKLIVFEGQGHEPQLDNFKQVNERMNVISKEIVAFFHKYTVPQIFFSDDVLQIGVDERMQGVEYKVDNGNATSIVVSGGIKVEPGALENRIIWFEDARTYSFDVVAENHLAGVNRNRLIVELVKPDR
jgi:pimeloyl-ACP methyl ester carboxylesterase